MTIHIYVHDHVSWDVLDRPTEFVDRVLSGSHRVNELVREYGFKNLNEATYCSSDRVHRAAVLLAFGAWPPYEAVEGPRALRAVCERQWVDVRIAVAGHLGRRGMPGAVGRDLAESLLRRFACGLPQETPADWEGFIASLGGLDDRVFDKDIETCLSDGLHRARRR